MIKIKAKSCTIIFLMTFFTAIILTYSKDSVVYALDIKGMVAKVSDFNTGPEKVEIDSYFFFESLGKQFDKQIKDHSSVKAIPFCLNNGRIFGTFAQYANLSYLAEDQLFDEVLLNSYGAFSNFPRNRLGHPLKSSSLTALYAVFQNIAKYHAIKSGIVTGSEKVAESDVRSWLKCFLNAAAQANPAKANYLSDPDKNGLIEFISDYDYFVMQYYDSLRHQIADPPIDGNLVMSVGFLRPSN